MLVAWTRGKKVGKHPGYEDEIVSAIFAPLRYLGGSDQSEFIEALVSLFFAKAGTRTTNSHGCRIEFWPNLSDHGRVEPDALVLFTCGTGTQTALIIEAKWGAELHPGQMDDQWRCAANRFGADSVLHLFIGRSTKQFDEKDGWGEHRGMRTTNATWASFARLTADLSRSRQNGLSLWARDVHQFLISCGHEEFRGFGSLDQARMRTVGEANYHFKARLIDMSRLTSMKSRITRRWIFSGERK